MINKYYAITKQSAEGFPLYLTARYIRGNNLMMFTGNKELAYTFKSTEEAQNFYDTHPWTELPQIDIIELEL